MPIILGENRQNAERLHFTLGEDITQVDSGADLMTWLDEHPDEMLVLVGADVAMETVTEIAEHYRTVRPSLGVVLLRRRLDVQVMSEALRAGVREVVSTEDAEAIVQAVQRSLEVSGKFADSEHRDLTTRRAQIIIVFSAKGGCGKTTVSTNLAEALAARRNAKVCLVDFDLEFGDVAVALHIDPKRSISAAVPMRGHIDRAAIESLVLPHRDGVDTLLAPVTPAEMEYVTADLAGEVLTQLRHVYDYVVVDSPPAFTEVILKTFDLADDFVLLTTLDMPAIKNLRVSLDTLDTLGYSREKWHVVVNRADSRVGLTVQDVETAIGMTVVAEIPSSIDVPATVNRGDTIFHADPRHPVSRAIDSLATAVAGDRGREDRRSGSARRLIFRR